MKIKYYVIFVILVLGIVKNSWAANVTIEASEFSSLQGEVIYLLLAKKDAETWPEGEEAAKCLIKERVIDKVMIQVCKDVPPGVYAVSVVHDKNSNGYLDHGLLGPIEDYGFSNNARGMFGPAKFEKCSFEVKNQDVTIKIELD